MSAGSKRRWTRSLTTAAIFQLAVAVHGPPELDQQLPKLSNLSAGVAHPWRRILSPEPLVIADEPRPRTI